MSNTLKIAACQFPVSGSMAANSRYIYKYSRYASEKGVDVIHFPEAALPGYVRFDFSSFSDFDWDELLAHTEKIMALAQRLNIWIILGSCRQVSREDKPRNCQQVISFGGDIIATYDKRKLYSNETMFYREGDRPITLTINNTKCGFLICYDSCFPSLYESYRKRDVRLLFHSYYNAKNEGGGTSLDDLILAQLRTRAADNQMWISASNSSARHSRLPACIARPDGSVLSTKRHIAGLIIHEIPDTELGWTYDNRNG